MKVCTDSCLFGAWVACKMEQENEEKEGFHPARMLDIGTGTGLLALMLAQQSPALIDAVEIEKNAFEQAGENFAASTRAQRLQVFHSDIKDFFPEEKYDFIISNPPFFENDLKSAAPAKNLAKHHNGLLLADLLSSIKNLLEERGKFALLLPFHRAEECINLAATMGFYLEEECDVKQTPGHHYFRAMLLFSREKKDIKKEEILIRDGKGGYSKEFEKLLEPYYL